MGKLLLFCMILLEFGPYVFPLLLTLGHVSRSWGFTYLPSISQKGCWPLHLTLYIVPSHRAQLLSGLHGKWHYPLNHLCARTETKPFYDRLRGRCTRQQRGHGIEREQGGVHGRFSGGKGERWVIYFYDNVKKPKV